MKKGYFGKFGGQYVPETLMAPLAELEKAYLNFKGDNTAQAELKMHLKNYVGRPTALTFANNLTKHLKGARIYFKREDLTHTGSHKINNALGQGLLAKFMGKSRIVAETGAGQHGVASATIAALLGLKCTVYMGAVDMERQALNVARMKFLGADVLPVKTGSRTLKDAVSEAIRDWVSHVDNTYYLLGSALGPHPYPTIVRDFQMILGVEAKQQIISACGKLPSELIACIGGGSNAIGLFYPFLEDKTVVMTGVEAGGQGTNLGEHAARFLSGAVGVFQGTKTYLLQDEHGQIAETNSIAAGLDYPGVGPEHAHLHDINRVNYTHAKNEEALEAARLVSRLEGVVPALESAHALAYVLRRAPEMSQNDIILVNISGRGDKDMSTYANTLLKR